MASLLSIGQPAGHVEGPAKVTGRMLYTADVALPGLRCRRTLQAKTRIPA